MKRTLLSPNSHRGRRFGAVLLAASLLAGPGLASPSAAVEPSPTATAAPTAPAPSLNAPATPTAPAPSASAASPSATSDCHHRLPCCPGPHDGGLPRRHGRSDRWRRSTNGPGASGRPAGRGPHGEDPDNPGDVDSGLRRQGLTPANTSPRQLAAAVEHGCQICLCQGDGGELLHEPALRCPVRRLPWRRNDPGCLPFCKPRGLDRRRPGRIFVRSGGGWSGDGYTMPPVLDLKATRTQAKRSTGSTRATFAMTCPPAPLLPGPGTSATPCRR